MNISRRWPIHPRKETTIINGRGNVQKSPSSKAAAIVTRGAYSQYVSTAQWRERRWRIFQHSQEDHSVLAVMRGKSQLTEYRSIAEKEWG